MKWVADWSGAIIFPENQDEVQILEALNKPGDRHWMHAAWVENDHGRQLLSTESFEQLKQKMPQGQALVLSSGE